MVVPLPLTAWIPKRIGLLFDFTHAAAHHAVYPSMRLSGTETVDVIACGPIADRSLCDPPKHLRCRRGGLDGVGIGLA